MDWTSLKHFKPEEFGNEEAVSHLDYNLVWLIDEFRDAVGKPFKIHCSWASAGHAEKGYHPKGQALDGHFEGLSLKEQFFLALKFGAFKGIGLYPCWHNPGLHLDIRKEPLAKIWWQDKAGKYWPINSFLDIPI